MLSRTLFFVLSLSFFLSLSLQAQEKAALDYAIQKIDRKPRKVLSYIHAEKSPDPKFDLSLVN